MDCKCPVTVVKNRLLSTMLNFKIKFELVAFILIRLLACFLEYLNQISREKDFYMSIERDIDIAFQAGENIEPKWTAEN